MNDVQYGLLMVYIGIVEGVAYFVPEPMKSALFGAVDGMIRILTDIKEKRK